MVDISDFDDEQIVKLIFHIWENTEYCAFFKYNPSVEKPVLTDDSVSTDVLHHPLGVDYLKGKLWRLGNFSDRTNVDPRFYDRDISSGAFQRHVDNFRKSLK